MGSRLVISAFMCHSMISGWFPGDGEGGFKAFEPGEKLGSHTKVKSLRLDPRIDIKQESQ